MGEKALMFASKRPLDQPDTSAISKATNHATLMTYRNVSGRYRGTGSGIEVWLRIDVDGPRPLNRISADYYLLAGDDKTYRGSMRVDAPTITVSTRHMTITGAAVFSFHAKCTCVSITIPLVPLSASSPARARLRHLPAPGAPGAVYDCEFASPNFRRVELEQACEQGVAMPAPYDPAALSSRWAPRQLTLVEAFADAGIEIALTGQPTIIDTSEAGPNTTWSDAELHAAMEAHFSRWSDRPRWAIWLMHAASHDDQWLAGVMFDQHGLQRQGCAVFYGPSTDTSAERLRHQLHTCVHELGHAFNLSHCWQQALTDPPLPGRPDALSWMNYPDRFPGGSSAYWQEFDFSFDESELVFLRHAFERDVMMGGTPFAGTGPSDRTPGWDVDLPHDPGLRLRLHAPRALVKDVPVTIGLELTATTRAGRSVPAVLGPRQGNVAIAIRKPNGFEFLFEPLLHHCRGRETITLRAGDRPLRDDAFIHYGKQGFAFDSPGRYQLRALFAQPNGRVAVSNVTSISIMPPVSRVDRHISDLIADEQQLGMILSLVGSDARALRRGDETLHEIISRYPAHPVAVIGRLVQAANLAHGFKRIDRDGRVRFREPKVREAAKLVYDVVDQLHKPGLARSRETRWVSREPSRLTTVARVNRPRQSSTEPTRLLMASSAADTESLWPRFARWLRERYQAARSAIHEAVHVPIRPRKRVLTYSSQMTSSAS
jgi:hypothetical protein